LIELMMGFPAMCFKASSITANSVESIITGTVTCWLNRLMASIISFFSSRPT